LGKTRLKYPVIAIRKPGENHNKRIILISSFQAKNLCPDPFSALLPKLPIPPGLFQGNHFLPQFEATGQDTRKPCGARELPWEDR
jgi:hypothetical protein